MSRRLPPSVEAGKRLRQVESLLDRALDDLAGKGSSSCARCAAMLAEAFDELQAFAGLVTEPPAETTARYCLAEEERAALRPRLKALLPKLSRAERLLAAAAEFYRGWCAAEPAYTYPAPGYRADCWPHNPALLTLEG